MNKIAIFSPPRSGSSWLGQIFNSSPNVLYKFQPNFAYSFPYSLSEDSTKEEIDNFIDELIISNDPFVNAKITISNKKGIEFNKEELKYLVFKETHYLNIIENILIKSDIKVIGLIRSPFATINSWIKTPKEFNINWDLYEEWQSGALKNNGKSFNFFGYDKWKEVAYMFLKLKEKFPNKFMLLKYEDLLEDNALAVNKLFDFCELELNEQTLTFLDEAKSNQDSDEYSVFKSKTVDKDWKEELPHYIIESIKGDYEFKKLNYKYKWV